MGVALFYTRKMQNSSYFGILNESLYKIPVSNDILPSLSCLIVCVWNALHLWSE